jgi:predicted 3-demethylubiquinone-9 3-methyltransferase (glyoxalase superfamily)
MQKITPFLWFNDNAEEAMLFYTSTFKNGKILHTMKHADGKVFGGAFEIEGNEFKVLNGGPQFNFTPAISLFVNCESQDEVDELWNKLSEGGKESRCGWLQDKYGLSWQIIPTHLGKYLSDPNPIKSKNVMQAMLKMDKIIIKDLEEAYQKE